MRLRVPTLFVPLLLIAASLLIGSSVAGAATGTEVTTPGCVVERTGGTATIHYAAGIGVSINLRDNSGWVANLDVDGTEFVDDESSEGYLLVRRDENDVRENFTCAELGNDDGANTDIVVTGPGCVVERTDGLNRFGRPGVAVIHYAAGVGDSVNLLSGGGWLAVLDVNGSSYEDDGSLDEYLIRRRSNGAEAFEDFVCTEVDEPQNDEPFVPPPLFTPVPVADGPIVVTGPGCVVERFGEQSRFGFTGTAVIHYAAGVGDSVNLLSGRWLAVLDVNGSSYEDDVSLDEYLIRRRSNGAEAFEDFVCTEVDEPQNDQPVPARNEG